MENKSFLGRGWSFPVDLDDWGRVMEAEEEESIKRSIEVILGTAKGERVMRPEFGSDLPGYLFRPVNPSTRGRIAGAVKDALLRWEPRIRVMEVKVEADLEHPATLLIHIEYRIRTSNTKSNMVYPFYLGGGVS